MADLVTLDLEAPTLAGLEGDAVLDAWLMAGGDDLVRDVWSAGRHVVQAGRHRARETIARRFVDVATRLRSAARERE